MDTQQMIASLACCLITGVCLIVSIRSFCQKGFLLNNTWILASETKRASMDKRDYYHQSAIVFLLLTFMFGALTVHLLTNEVFWRGFSFGTSIVAVIYAVVSELLIHRKIRKRAEPSCED